MRKEIEGDFDCAVASQDTDVSNASYHSIGLDQVFVSELSFKSLSTAPSDMDNADKLALFKKDNPDGMKEQVQIDADYKTYK